MVTEFDYKGYTEDQLLSLCCAPIVDEQASSKYWPTRAYSAGVFLRKYAYYPASWPLICYCAHGANFTYQIGKHELSTDAPLMLYYTETHVKKYKKLSDKPVHKVPTPFSWLRRNLGILQSQKAKGTLAFFSHTTPDITFVEETKVVVNTYIDELLKLPAHLSPICVCLHMYDVNNGSYKYFLERNIPVYTAGNAYSNDFAERFYSILKNFSFSTANILGSNAWYSIEMGIPFFLYGKKPDQFNKTSEEVKKGLYVSYKNEAWEKAMDLFPPYSPLTPIEITDEQAKFTENLLGKKNSISRVKLSFLLYKNYILSRAKARFPLVFNSGFLQNLPELPLDSKIFPNDQTRGLLHMDGWSVLENWGCWSDGKKASIIIKVAKNAKGVTLSNIMHIPQNSSLDLTVRINKINVSSKLYKDAVSELDLPLPRSVQKKLHKNNIVKIDFLMPNVKSPQELSLSSDNRKLGIGLKDITIY